MKLTDLEREILKNIDSRWNYIAKDWDGSIFMYEEKPHLRSDCIGVWTADRGDEYELSDLKEIFGDANLFSGLDWGVKASDADSKDAAQTVYSRAWKISDILAADL